MSREGELRERVIEELKKIYDPEIPINIYDLGFIYNIDIDGGKVHILMTLTVPGCPMHQVLANMIKEKLSQLDGVDEVDVELTFDPRWTIDRISEDGKAKLRELGYNI